VRQVFEWVGRDRCSIGEVRRRLEAAQERTRTGKRSGIAPPSAACSTIRPTRVRRHARKTVIEPLRPRLRAPRGSSLQPKHAYSHRDLPPEQWMSILYPPWSMQRCLMRGRTITRKPRAGSCSSTRRTLFLQGLLVCACCGYARLAASRLVPADANIMSVPTPTIDASARTLPLGGVRLCWNKQLRTDLVEEAVWKKSVGS